MALWVDLRFCRTPFCAMLVTKRMTLPPSYATTPLMFGFSRKSTGERFALDPFAMWPNHGSRVAGLGDDRQIPHDDVVFHTAYLPFGAGWLTFEIAFDNLTATSGKLDLIVLELSNRRAGAAVVKRQSVSMQTIARGKTKTSVSIRARDEASYALCGRIRDDTDARASALHVFSDREKDDSLLQRQVEEARTTIFGPISEPSDDNPLVVASTATLATPRSQMCTASQFDEPDYARWLTRINRPMHRHRKQWEHIFICRTFEVMGAYHPHARALGFGCGMEPIPAAIAAYDIFVTASDLPVGDERAENWRHSAQLLVSLDDLRDPDICPNDLFDQRVELQPIDMTAIPDERRDYDMCWSSCALEHLGSIDAGLTFIERSLDTLKPGGVAVHTTELNLTSDTTTVDSGGTVLFRRRDIEGFARRLRALGHYVAPLTFDMGDQPEDRHIDTPPYTADNHLKLALDRYVSTSFGLVIRKSPQLAAGRRQGGQIESTTSMTMSRCFAHPGASQPGSRANCAARRGESGRA